MTSLPSDALVTRQKWFSTDIEFQGNGQAHIQSLNTCIEGATTIHFDSMYRVTVRMEIERISPDTVSFWELWFNSREHKSTLVNQITVKAPDGLMFVASRVYENAFSSGSDDEPAHIIWSAYDSEIIVSNDTPIFWAIPLSNFISRFRSNPADLLGHPLRINPSQPVISFDWNSASAFIEPLVDYKQREEYLEQGHASNLLTAIMVGTVGQNRIDAANLTFPNLLLSVLGFATGNSVGAPWVEFRDIKGKLVKRVFRHFGSPTYHSGRPVIEELFNTKTGNLLNAVLSSSFCETAVYRVLLHHASIAGTDGQTIDDRLSHLFRAFDRLCQEHGLKTVFLRGKLEEPIKSNALITLDQAVNDLIALGATSGDSDTQKTLQQIANRVRSADQTDRDFGTAVCMLALEFGFKDEAAMDAHLSTNPLSPRMTTWQAMLSAYRNINMHDAFYDTSDPAFSTRNIYGMNLHLLDLLTRILLAKSGYTGLYRPIPAIWRGTMKPLDWVNASTPASELGYHNLM